MVSFAPYIGTTETWALFRLSNGKLHITDPSTAARTLLFNIHTRQWDVDLLNIFGVPSRILPVVVASQGFIGDCQFGDGVSRPVHALLVDQTAALFGQACFRAGDIKCSFGTGSFLLLNSGTQPVLSDNGLLTTIAWDGGDLCYALDGVSYMSVPRSFFKGCNRLSLLLDLP